MQESARPFVEISAPVAAALAAGRPVVALESTIVTHGMPFPQNAEMAARVEAIIGEEGAVLPSLAVWQAIEDARLGKTSV